MLKIAIVAALLASMPLEMPKLFAGTPLPAEPPAEKQKPPKLEKKKLGTTRPVHALGNIYLAGQPQPEDLANMKSEGIKTIITLRKPQEVPWDEATAVEKQGMTYVAVPFAGPAELKPEVFDKVLKVLRDKKRGPTVLHCGSANRVGGIWYAYRILDGNLTPEAALAEAKVVGLRTPGYLEKAKEYVELQKNKAAKKETAAPSKSR